MKTSTKTFGFAMPLLLSAPIALAQSNATLQELQNQAAIAAAQATIATSQASTATAQATAQQTLAAAQLANQKTEISNIQSALTAPDPSKLRAVSSLDAPKVNATFYRVLSENLQAWFDKGVGTPVNDLSTCDLVLLSGPSLNNAINLYRSTKSKLYSIRNDLETQMKIVENLTAKPVAAPAGKKKPPKLGFRSDFGTNSLIGPMAAATVAVGVANLAVSFAAAAKPVTTVSSQPLDSTTKIVMGYVKQKLADLPAPVAAPGGPAPPGPETYDAEAAIGMPYDDNGADAQCNDPLGSPGWKALSLTGRAACVQSAIQAAKEKLSQTKLVPLDPNAKTDPDKDLRDAVQSLGKFVTQSDSDFRQLFAADSTSGVIPFNVAMQGEIYSGLMEKKTADKTCILNVSAVTSDADVKAVDGTFTSYKLYVATTTTISWTVSRPSGQIVKAGAHAISIPWKRQELE